MDFFLSVGIILSGVKCWMMTYIVDLLRSMLNVLVGIGISRSVHELKPCRGGKTFSYKIYIFYRFNSPRFSTVLKLKRTILKKYQGLRRSFPALRWQQLANTQTIRLRGHLYRPVSSSKSNWPTKFTAVNRTKSREKFFNKFLKIPNFDFNCR